MRKEIKKLLDSRFERSVVVEIPKESKFGQFATPVAFSLAKEYRKSPMVIAEELANELSGYSQFSKVEAVKGYLNFHLSEDFLNGYSDGALVDGDNFGSGDRGERILLEFVSANPTGPLHIGHARGAIYGDTLLRLGRHLGYEIDSEYYINDAGRQIDLLGISISLAGRELLGESVEYPEEYYRGEYIVDIARKAIEELGEEIFQLESLGELASWGKDQMMEEIRSNLQSAGIEFDLFVSELDIFSDWSSSQKILKEKSAIYEDGGKLWLKSTQYGDEKDRVVVRENGVPTYLAGDITYHHNKFEREYDRYINIWGADHHGYIKRVQSAVEFLGFDSKKLEILLTQMVALLRDGEPYKMSKRAGNFILMRDVVDEVGADALRFTFASKTPDTSLQFDVSDLLKEDSSNPIYYINYAHARVNSLLKKSGVDENRVRSCRIKLEDSSEARELLFTALRLPEIIEESFESRQVQKLAEYLYNLASEYHSFYNKNQVVGTDREAQLLKLSLVVSNSIRVGLSLLGIEAKNRM
jgi:arginyl-tRNA synthetase